VSLTTVPINLWEFSRPTLQFQTCYDLETDYDYGHVEISTDEGATWTNVATYTGRTVHWSDRLVDLGVIFGAETLRVRFRLDTDAGVTADGWYIDNVAVYFDDDLDDDGIPNDVEVGEDPTNPIDTDGDGIPDYLDYAIYMYFPSIFK
jgi:bacillopeptidase F (M6 metalloprotease family)